jgi:hypothetical protein
MLACVEVSRSGMTAAGIARYMVPCECPVNDVRCEAAIAAN